MWPTFLDVSAKLRVHFWGCKIKWSFKWSFSETCEKRCRANNLKRMCVKTGCNSMTSSEPNEAKVSGQNIGKPRWSPTNASK